MFHHLGVTYARARAILTSRQLWYCPTFFGTVRVGAVKLTPHEKHDFDNGILEVTGWVTVEKMNGTGL